MHRAPILWGLSLARVCMGMREMESRVILTNVCKGYTIAMPSLEYVPIRLVHFSAPVLQGQWEMGLCVLISMSVWPIKITATLQERLAQTRRGHSRAHAPVITPGTAFYATRGALASGALNWTH